MGAQYRTENFDCLMPVPGITGTLMEIYNDWCTQPATTEGAYTCGSTMEECEAAYLAASTPAISVMEPTMTLDGCDDLDSSWVNNVVNGLSGWDSDSMKLCANNGQYAVEVDGMVYPLRRLRNSRHSLHRRFLGLPRPKRRSWRLRIRRKRAKRFDACHDTS